MYMNRKDISEKHEMAVQRSSGEIIKMVAWLVGAVALVGGLIHFAPIISHGN